MTDQACLSPARLCTSMYFYVFIFLPLFFSPSLFFPQAFSFSLLFLLRLSISWFCTSLPRCLSPSNLFPLYLYPSPKTFFFLSLYLSVSRLFQFLCFSPYRLSPSLSSSLKGLYLSGFLPTDFLYLSSFLPQCFLPLCLFPFLFFSLSIISFQALSLSVFYRIKCHQIDNTYIQLDGCYAMSG